MRFETGQEPGGGDESSATSGEKDRQPIEPDVRLLAVVIRYPQAEQLVISGPNVAASGPLRHIGKRIHGTVAERGGRWVDENGDQGRTCCAVGF